MHKVGFVHVTEKTRNDLQWEDVCRAGRKKKSKKETERQNKSGRLLGEKKKGHRQKTGGRAGGTGRNQEGGSPPKSLGM